MGRRQWAWNACVVLLAVIGVGWLISVIRPTVFRAYGLGQRGIDGMFNCGIEVGCYSGGLGFNVDRIGHTPTGWVALQSYHDAHIAVDMDGWRWRPQIRRIGGPLGWWTEVFVPFWALAAGVGVVMALLRWAPGRFARGCCRRCGYDLRGLAGACPECGAGRRV